MTALSIDAELVVEGDGHTYRVWSEDDRFVVGAPSLSALRALDDFEGALPVPIDTFGSGLASVGVGVDVQVRRATVARLGAGTDGGPLGRWLTGTDATLDLSGVVTAAVRALG